jgi:hypothetical protein
MARATTFPQVRQTSAPVPGAQTDTNLRQAEHPFKAGMTIARS